MGEKTLTYKMLCVLPVEFEVSDRDTGYEEEGYRRG